MCTLSCAFVLKEASGCVEERETRWLIKTTLRPEAHYVFRWKVHTLCCDTAQNNLHPVADVYANTGSCGFIFFIWHCCVFTPLFFILQFLATLHIHYRSCILVLYYCISQELAELIQKINGSLFTFYFGKNVSHIPTLYNSKVYFLQQLYYNKTYHNNAH